MLNDLPDYLLWANTRIAQLLQQTPTETGVGILAHLLAAEAIWAGRITGESVSYPLRPDWDLSECLKQASENAACYRQIVAVRQGQDEVNYRNIQGQEFTSSVQDILLQVMTHGAHHRGQITQEIRRAGGETVDIDYILFKRQ